MIKTFKDFQHLFFTHKQVFTQFSDFFKTALNKINLIKRGFDFNIFKIKKILECVQLK